MSKDFEKKHIETEIKFYKKMSKKKSFLITLLIVGVGFLFLYNQFLSIDHSESLELWIWTLIVVILFVSEMLIGYSVFEYERKKYVKN